MKYAAFFRNVNLGRPNCPGKAQLESAFLSAGAATASSFLVNGTLVFTVKPTARPRKVLAAACAALRAQCGLKEPAYIRRVDELAELVALDPFARVDRTGVYECCVTFLHPSIAQHPALPLESGRGDVQVLRFTDGEVFSVSRKIGSSPGSPNAFVEKLFGLPATTRSWNTIVRLVRRDAA
jgi:uncharacterized protein (DUF1697 family)